MPPHVPLVGEPMARATAQADLQIEGFTGNRESADCVVH